MRISVVIPTLDEERLVEAAVASVREGADEVLVVDGGSADATRERARAAGARVLEAPRGRGAQLDAGARQAAGDWLVFLHADTRLEAGWPACLAALAPATPGGAFRFAIDAPGPGYRFMEAGAHLRCRIFGLPYGDQALFVRREVYGRIGGFRPLPLMEDVDFVRRLARAGRLALVPARAFTSARRWQQRGLFQTMLINWYIVTLYTLGRSPERLARVYGVPGTKS